MLDKDAFHERGLIVLRRFVARKAVAAAREAILQKLPRVLPARLADLPTFQQTVRLSQLVGPCPLTDHLFSASLLAAINDLAEAQLTPLHAHAQLLITLPQKREWTTEGARWHVDRKVQGVQAFLLLDDVAPRGGATLALAGSHRVPKPALEIVEMTGEAGDIHLMDLRVQHAPSVNASRRTRLMATQRYLPRQAVG